MTGSGEAAGALGWPGTVTALPAPGQEGTGTLRFLHDEGRELGKNSPKIKQLAGLLSH